MHSLKKAVVILVILAGASAYAADYFGLAHLIPLAMALFGVLISFIGVNSLTQGRLSLREDNTSRREYYADGFAYLLGAMIMFFGAGLLFYGIWSWLQPQTASGFLAKLVESHQSWGLLLMAIGFFTCVFGLARLIAGSGQPAEPGRERVDRALRIRGLLSMLVGVVVLAGGFWLLIR
jgi:hypothetical protein